MKIKKVDSTVAIAALSVCKRNLRKLVDFYISTGLLDALIKQYGEDTIFRAIDNIYYDGVDIRTPYDSTYEQVLKYLQFGGYKLPALNLLSRAVGGIYG